MTNLCAVLWQHVNTKQEIHSAKQMHVWTVLTKSDCSMIILALNLILHASLWLFPLEQYKIPTQSPQVAHVHHFHQCKNWSYFYPQHLSFPTPDYHLLICCYFVCMSIYTCTYSQLICFLICIHCRCLKAFEIIINTAVIHLCNYIFPVV